MRIAKSNGSDTHSAGGFLFGMLGVGLSFGGIMGVFPSLCMERYGPRDFGVNYGILFAGYSLAAILGPRVGAAIGQRNGGDFTQAFLLAVGLSILGALVTWWARLQDTSAHPNVEHARKSD